MLTGKAGNRGFTIVELLAVLAVLALLTAIVAPSLTSSLLRSKESALVHSLAVMRKAIDEYHADNGAYPPSLESLVDGRYIRSVPKDPVTGSRETWKEIYSNEKGGICDIYSGAEGRNSDGERYDEL